MSYTIIHKHVFMEWYLMNQKNNALIFIIIITLCCFLSRINSQMSLIWSRYVPPPLMKSECPLETSVTTPIPNKLSPIESLASWYYKTHLT